MNWFKIKSAEEIHDGKKYFLVKRVPYGKPSTPIELREYQMYLGSSVGTRSEFEAYFKEQNLGKKYQGIAFQEDAKTIEYVDILAEE